MRRRLTALLAVLGVLAAGCSSTESGTGGASVGASASASSPAPTPASSGSSAARTTPVVASPVAKPVRTPCTANTRPQWVLVSLRRQHLWMCARHRLVRDTPITSGMLGQYTETPTGDYAIQGLTRDTSLTLITGDTYAVKFWIPFDAPLFGFHDSSWQDFPYGSAEYETRGSHGCVHVPLAAIRFLYHWAHVGTPVRIKA